MVENMVELESSDIVDNNIEKLKQLFPDIVKDGKINFDTLKLVLGEEVEKDKESYKFEWSGKTDCYKTIQSPSLGTLKPQKEESIDFDNSENIIIEGDNLEVLKLLQSNYSNKIKMIYIDPPYNTGSDFVYPDNFSTPLENYFEQTGQTENGETTQSNKSKDGRKHTQWLNMIFPRLMLSRTLLKEDGVIFISIDDNEYDNLKKISDEVFGEENFIGTLKWKRKKQPSFLHGQISKVMEYIVIYSKNKEKVEKLSIEKRTDGNTRIDNGSNNTSERIIKKGVRVKLPKDIKVIKKGCYKNKTMTTEYLNDVFIKNGRTTNDMTVKGQFRNQQTELDKFVDNDVIFITKNYGFRRDLLEEELDKRKSITDLLLDWGDNQDSDKEMTSLFGDNKPFEYTKPSILISKLVQSLETDNEIILDFFGGSGTTGQSVLELNKDKGNRKFILVQLPEKTGNPDFPTICEITKERIRRVINGYGENPKPINDGFKVFKLDKSNYVINEKLSIKPNITDTDREDLITQLRKQFENSTIHDECLIKNYRQLDVVYEVILKEGYSLNSKIEEIKILDINVYKVVDNSKKCYITFDDIDTNIIKDKEFIGIPKDTIFVCLDKGLTDSDKSNLSLSFQLKTI